MSLGANGTLVSMHLMSGRSSHHREGKSTQPSQVRLLLRQPASGGINTGRCDTIQCDTFGTLLVYATGMDFGTAPFTSSRFPHRVSVSLVCFLDPLGVLYHRSRNWRVAGFMPALLYPLAPSTHHLLLNFLSTGLSSCRQPAFFLSLCFPRRSL